MFIIFIYNIFILRLFITLIRNTNLFSRIFNNILSPTGNRT